jgi:hypothetical protein
MAWPCFGQDTHGVKTFVAPQLDDEMRGTPFATQYLLLDRVGKTFTPRTIIMSSDRPVTFSIRRIDRCGDRAVLGSVAAAFLRTLPVLLARQSTSL